ncbi:MAG: SRPBCC family protein [Nitriliruptoraceae bacterium]
MTTITRSIDVDVPVRTAYDQWTQFEEFPSFMKDVERVEQLDDTTLRWHVNIAGVERSFETTITEQTPDQRVAWTTEPGSDTWHAGVVTFHRLDDGVCRVTLQMDVEPDDVVEKVGTALGITAANIQRDLEGFKAFIESRGEETGAWRGEVSQDPQA